MSHQHEAAERRAGMPHADGLAHMQRHAVIRHTRCESVSMPSFCPPQSCASPPKDTDRCSFPRWPVLAQEEARERDMRLF